MQTTYVIQNENTKEFVACDILRERGAEYVNDIENAAILLTRAAAYDFNQNYGPEFDVIPTRDAT